MVSNLKQWKQSATAIIVAKTSLSSTSNFNYNVLMVKRNKKSSVLPNATVFPGGSIDKADTSRDWLNLYEKFGFKPESLEILNSNNDIASLFHTTDPNEIPKTISLRIAAIRETFEETGILMCKNIKNISEETSSWADCITSEEVKNWQQRIHQNPDEFIKLCSHFEIFPDLWSLYEWSNWCTPTTVLAKFNAIFFMVVFQTKPKALADNEEISLIQWNTPQQYLTIWKEEKYWATVPQLYEISRLVSLPNISYILSLCKEHSKMGLERWLTHIIKTDSGHFFIFPGDDLYPTHIDESNEHVEYLKEITDSNVQHRMKVLPSGEKRLLIKNYTPKFIPIVPIINKL